MIINDDKGGGDRAHRVHSSYQLWQLFRWFSGGCSGPEHTGRRGGGGGGGLVLILLLSAT